jgi:hypothetical protein
MDHLKKWNKQWEIMTMLMSPKALNVSSEETSNTESSLEVFLCD